MKGIGLPEGAPRDPQEGALMETRSPRDPPKGFRAAPGHPHGPHKAHKRLHTVQKRLRLRLCLRLLRLRLSIVPKTVVVEMRFSVKSMEFWS